MKKYLLLLIVLFNCTQPVINTYTVQTGTLSEKENTTWYIYTPEDTKDIGELKILFSGVHLWYNATDLDGITVYYCDIINAVKIDDSKNVLRKNWQYKIVLFN